jgi:hypothetical protein
MPEAQLIQAFDKKMVARKFCAVIKNTSENKK